MIIESIFHNIILVSSRFSLQILTLQRPALNSPWRIFRLRYISKNNFRNIFESVICLGCGWLVQPNAKSIEEPKQDTLWGPWHWLLVPFFDNQWWNSHQSLVKMWEAFFKLNYPLLSTFPEKRIFSGQTMWLKGSLHRL